MEIDGKFEEKKNEIMQQKNQELQLEREKLEKK